jgi:hypothetical protein
MHTQCRLIPNMDYFCRQRNMGTLMKRADRLNLGCQLPTAVPVFLVLLAIKATSYCKFGGYRTVATSVSH